MFLNNFFFKNCYNFVYSYMMTIVWHIYFMTSFFILKTYKSHTCCRLPEIYSMFWYLLKKKKLSIKYVFDVFSLTKKVLLSTIKIELLRWLAIKKRKRLNLKEWIFSFLSITFLVPSALIRGIMKWSYKKKTMCLIHKLTTFNIVSI